MQHAAVKTLIKPCLLACALATIGSAASAAKPDLIVSTSDAKYVRVVGKDTFLDNPASDKLDVIDASSFPPKVVASVDVAAAIQGPPQAVAISPDGKLVAVSAPSRYDAAAKKLVLENYLQVVDLEAMPPQVISKIELSVTLIDVSRRPFRAMHHATVPSIPEGVAISPDGRWVAVQAMDGSNLPSDNAGRHSRGKLILFANRGGTLVQRASLPAGEAGLGVVFSADSRYILAQYNVEKQIAVFAVNGGALKDTGERLPSAGGPSSIRSMPR